MQQLYEDMKTEGCLLIDADNAFNRMNRKVVLGNIQMLCPKLSPFFSNTYRTPTMIFTGNGIISSEEGTNQGDSNVRANNSAAGQHACGCQALLLR